MPVTPLPASLNQPGVGSIEWPSPQGRHQAAPKRWALAVKVPQHSAQHGRQRSALPAETVCLIAAARRNRGERAHVQVRDFLHCSRDALQRAAAVRLQRGVHILRCQVHVQLQVRKVPAR